MPLTPAVISLIGQFVSTGASMVQKYAGVDYGADGRPKLNETGRIAGAFSKLGSAASMYGGFMEKIGDLKAPITTSTKGNGLSITGAIDDPSSAFGGMVSEALGGDAAGSAPPLGRDLYSTGAFSNKALGGFDPYDQMNFNPIAGLQINSPGGSR